MYEQSDVEAHMDQQPRRNGESVWKWVSAILATIMLAGAPGYLYLYLNTPTASEFGHVRENQQLVLTRLAVLEQQHEEFMQDIADLRQRVETLSERGGG